MLRRLVLMHCVVPRTRRSICGDPRVLACVPFCLGAHLLPRLKINMLHIGLNDFRLSHPRGFLTDRGACGLPTLER